MEPGPASIGYAISILILTPIAIALIYIIRLGAKTFYGNAVERWSIGMVPYLAGLDRSIPRYAPRQPNPGSRRYHGRTRSAKRLGEAAGAAGPERFHADTD